MDDGNRDFLQQRVTANVHLDHNYQCARVHTTSSNVSAPSTLPVELNQEQEQRASTGKRSNQFQKAGRNLPGASSRSPRALRAGKKRRAIQGRYLCTICETDYAQPQGLTRHEQEKHKAKLCTYCSEFTYGRPYVFREHLVKRHPDIDPNAAISKATRTRRSSTTRRYLPRQRISVPTDEYDSWDHADSQAHTNPHMSSPSTVANLTPTGIFLPNIPSMAYDPQPESTEPAIKEMRKIEDAFTLEPHDTNGDHTISPSTEEGSQPAISLDMSTRAMQFWLVLRMHLTTPSMISDPPPILSGFRIRGRWSERLELLLPTAHRPRRLRPSSRPHHLLVDMVAARSL